MGMIETAVTMFRVGGHSHNGINSTKVDFSEYSDEDLAPILSRFRAGQENSTSGGGTLTAVTFSFPGALGAVASPLFYFPNAMTLSSVHLSLGTTASSTTTVNLYKNNTLVGTASLVGGVKGAATNMSMSFGKDDYMQMIVGTVGSGGSNLTAQARF